MPQPCCDHRIFCPEGAGNLDYDSPIKNISAERPDPITFLGINWGWDRLAPPLNKWWTANSCLGVCESDISQADADACAAANELACYVPGWGDPVPRNPPPGPPEVPPREVPIYTNDPESCSSQCPDGLTFTYTTPAGKYAAPSQLRADRMAASEACRFAVSARMCLSDLAPRSCCTGHQYLAVLQCSGGVLPLGFSVVSGALPPGIVLSQGPGDRDVSLAGLPTAGSFTFTIRVDDSIGNFMQKTYTLEVGGIDQATLPDATVNTAYSETLTASNLVAPFQWELVSGTLPDGLNFNNVSGEIFGTPTTVQTANLTFAVTDFVGTRCTRDLTLAVVETCFIDHFLPTDSVLTISPGGTGAGFDAGVNNFVFINRAQQFQAQPTIASFVCPDGRVYGANHPITTGLWTQPLGGAAATFGPSAAGLTFWAPSDNDYFAFRDNTGPTPFIDVFFPGSGIVATLGNPPFGADVSAVANPMGPSGHLLWQDQNTLNWHLWTPGSGDQNTGAVPIAGIVDTRLATTGHGIIFGTGGLRLWDGLLWALITGLNIADGSLNASDHIVGMYNGGTQFFTWSLADGLVNIGLPPGAAFGIRCFITNSGLIVVGANNGGFYYANGVWGPITDLFPVGHGAAAPIAIDWVDHGGFATGSADFSGNTCAFIAKLCSPP